MRRWCSLTKNAVLNSIHSNLWPCFAENIWKHYILKSGSKVFNPNRSLWCPNFDQFSPNSHPPQKKTRLLPDVSDVLKVRKVRLPQESFRLACSPHCPMWSRLGGFNFHGGNGDQHGSTMRFWGTLFWDKVPYWRTMLQTFQNHKFNSYTCVCI